MADIGTDHIQANGIDRIVTIGASHSVAAQGDLATRYDRRKGIWHAFFFQMPSAEQAVAANDDAFLESWWRDATPEYDPPAGMMEQLKTMSCGNR